MPFGKIFKKIGGALPKIGKGALGVVKGATGLLGSFGIPIPGLPPGLSAAMPHLGAFGAGAADLASGLLGGQGMSPEEEGRRAGRVQRAFFKEAFPGTNPWEHLGSGQSGGTQSSIARESRALQESMNRRTLSTQASMNRQNALATLGSKIIEDFPEAAQDVVDLVARNGTSAGPNLSNSVKRSRLNLDDQVQRFNALTSRGGVDVQALNAVTQRIMADLAGRRLDFDKATREADVAFRNKDQARQYVETMQKLYDSLGSNPWRALRTTMDEMRATDRGFSLVEELGKAMSKMDLPPVRQQGMSAPARPLSKPPFGARRGGVR